jgi:hypothetical protein
MCRRDEIFCRMWLNVTCTESIPWRFLFWCVLLLRSNFLVSFYLVAMYYFGYANATSEDECKRLQYVIEGSGHGLFVALTQKCL